MIFFLINLIAVNATALLTKIAIDHLLRFLIERNGSLFSKGVEDYVPAKAFGIALKTVDTSRCGAVQ